MSNIAIKAENISKYYRLGQINNGTLYADIQSWFARKFHREDPHAKIGFDSAQCDKDGFWALKDIDFEIKQGDRVGIIGRNGAGKSTLLKVISEITTPTTGNIYIKGRVASLLEVGTGFHPEMTGRENIYMNGAILGMKKTEITRQLDEIIDFAEIEKHIDTPVKRYSSGMYVRLAFAVAAHLQSEILIADEVLAVGDAEFQKKAIGKMSDLSTGEGRTVLFVSHNMAQIRALCKTGIVLDHGKTVFSGNIDKATEYYLTSSTNNKKIIDNVKVYRHSLHLKRISINGIEECEIPVSAQTKEIRICIEGTADENMTCDIMVQFKNMNGAPLATYSLGHYKGEERKIAAGDFSFTTVIDIPRYIGNGDCLASIFLHHPGIEYLADIIDSIKFSFEGRHDELGNVMEISQRGFFGLEGHNE